jgi:hypothetical protein
MTIVVSGKAKEAFRQLKELGMLRDGEGVIYQGRRMPDGRETILRIEFIKPRYPNDHEHIVDLFEASEEEKKATGFVSWPRGYEWGTFSPGAELLAFGILLDALGDIRQAMIYKGSFMRRFVFTWGTHWGINAEQVRSWVELKERYADA